MGERKLMGGQECGEKSRIETRLDFGGLPRSFFCDYLPPKRPFANRPLTTLIRSNPARQKMELSGKNRGSKTRAAVSPLSTGFTTFDQLHLFRLASPRPPRRLKTAPRCYTPSGVFVFSQKIENLVIARLEFTTSRFSLCRTDRYAIGPETHPAHQHGAQMDSSRERIAFFPVVAWSQVPWSGRIAFFHKDQTSEPLRGN